MFNDKHLEYNLIIGRDLMNKLKLDIFLVHLMYHEKE